MTSFVHIEYSNQHAGVSRVEAAFKSAASSAQRIKRNFSSTRSLATLLLSAIAAAVLVVAYQVMDSMAEGHLLALWIGMWIVAFATLAAFASTARQLVVKVKTSLDGWSRNIAAKRADERLWAMAKSDARLMADLQCAISRGEVYSDPRDVGLRFVPPAMAPAAAVVKHPSIPSGIDLVRAYRSYYI